MLRHPGVNNSRKPLPLQIQRGGEERVLLEQMRMLILKVASTRPIVIAGPTTQRRLSRCNKQEESTLQPEVRGQGTGVRMRSFLPQKSPFQGTEQDGEWIWDKLRKTTKYLSRKDLRMVIQSQIFCCLVDKSCPTLLGPHKLQPARLLCSWDFPGKNTEVGYHFLLPGIFLTQGSNPHLLHWQPDSLPLSHKGSP